MKILLATDGSSCSGGAVNEVANRPWPEGSTVKILSVLTANLREMVANEVYDSMVRIIIIAGKAQILWQRWLRVWL